MAKRKGEHMKLGRPVGPSKNLLFDPLTDKIDMRSIAKLLDVLSNTLYV